MRKNVPETEDKRFRWLDLLRARGAAEDKGLAEGEQQRLRSHVANAANILSPKGPIHAFVAQNPLQGLEHLPFEAAVHEARRLLGGLGYLSNEVFRRVFAAGRITRDDLMRALQAKVPDLANRPQIELRGRRVTALDVHLTQMLHEIEPLPHGALRFEIVHTKATQRFRQDLPRATREDLLNRGLHEFQGMPWRPGKASHLPASPPSHTDPGLEAYVVSALWEAVLAVFGLQGVEPVENRVARWEEVLVHRALAVARDGAMPVSRSDFQRSALETLERDLARVGQEFTLADFCHRITGARLTRLINDQMIRWCANFLDEGLAGWPMPHREHGFYEAWRRLAERDLGFMFMGVKNSAHKIRQLPPHPDDAIIHSLRTMGIPEERWTGYLTHHLACLPGWASMVKWREAHPDYEMQQRHPFDLAQYLAVRLFYEVELVSALCRKEWEIQGTIPALHAYFQTHLGEYFARGEVALGDLPDSLGIGIIRSGEGAVTLDWDAFCHPAYGDMRGAKGLSRSEQWERFGGMLYVYRWGGGDGHDIAQSVCHDAWRLFHLVQLLGLSAEDVRALSGKSAKDLVALLDDLPPAAHGPIWLEAYETHYRDQLLALIRRGNGKRMNGDVQPRAQLIFCLDAREEGIRRHLEAQSGSYETLGTAGFFSLPMIFRPLSSGGPTLSCPIVISPRHTVFEMVRPGQDLKENQRERRGRWKEVLHDLYHRLETHATAYYLIDLLGIPFGIGVAARTLHPSWWRSLIGGISERFIPPVRTRLSVNGQPKGEAESNRTAIHEAPQGRLHSPHAAAHPAAVLSLDFSEAEQADIVEGQLRMIGLTQGFARLVVFCGHGSTTENNPYAPAYHCGACGGNRGGPNGRAIAAMANNPRVRALLSQRGVVIPEHTYVLGAEHDTAADCFTYFDTEDIPPTHREDFTLLARDLYHAAGFHAQERCRSLPRAPERPTSEQALRHVRSRSLDWAQVYPEWGHARCASMLIGRRALTRGVFLDRRAYLQSYDPGQDPDGAILEEIMAAFVPVVRGITLDYYFSCVDSAVRGVLGAGTKALHNVVGLIGVMQGAGGDLKTGLPYQGVAPLHEPMRVQVIVESDPAKVASIIERHQVLRNVFTNGWAHLIAWDPEPGQLMEYQRDGMWAALYTKEQIHGVQEQQS